MSQTKPGICHHAPGKGRKMIKCEVCCPEGMCDDPTHKKYGKKATRCELCNWSNFCHKPEHAQGKGGPRTLATCHHCSPHRFCFDKTHRRGAYKDLVNKQACPDCTPDRFCNNPDHPRGVKGRPRVKTCCWECHPENFCSKHGSPIPKKRCTKCGNPPQKRYYTKVVVRRRRKIKKKAPKVTPVKRAVKRKRVVAPQDTPIKRFRPLSPRITDYFPIVKIPTLNRINSPEAEKNPLIDAYAFHCLKEYCPPPMPPLFQELVDFV